MQEAAGIMIKCLINTDDLVRAEVFALQTYANLKDPKNGANQDSEEMVKATNNLATIILKQKGDLTKAEEFARESLRINTIVFGTESNPIGVSKTLLGEILMSQNKLNDETKGLFEYSLAIAIKSDGPDSQNTGIGNVHVGIFYMQLACSQCSVDLKYNQLLLAKSHFLDACRIYTKIHGPNYQNIVEIKSVLHFIFNELSSCIL
jgi:hypothetical protein